MNRPLLFSFLVIGLILIGAGSGNAQTSSVAGEWDGAFNTPGGTRPFKFVLEVDGENLTGTAKRASGDLPIKGTIKGDVVEFSYTINYNGNDLTMFFSERFGRCHERRCFFGGQAEDAWSERASKK